MTNRQNLTNVKLTIEYDGTNFVGWQVQKSGRSVQAVLQTAIEQLTGERAPVYGSGRTDSGTHARGQVANFFTSSKIPPKKFADALNSVLPRDVTIRSSIAVPHSFHSRYSAKKKTYLYYVFTGKTRPAIERKYCYHFPRQLDIERIKSAVDLFIGEKSFKAFSKASADKKSYVRRIETLSIIKKGNKVIFKITGNGFLHNMVRSIVGSLLDVGAGMISEKQVKEAFRTENRALAGRTLPAIGLFLERVVYGDK